MNDLTIPLPTPNGNNGKKRPLTEKQLAVLKKNHFKSKAELGGKLDPHINAGGRPKWAGVYYEYLKEIDPDTGLDNQRTIAKNMIKKAKSDCRDSVNAAKEIRAATDGDDETAGKKVFIGNVNLAMIQRLVNGESEK